MAFQLSPGVLVTEKDLTNIVPAVATSTGAFAGAFVWGPVLEPTMVASENDLAQKFGKPVDGNATSFFTAANFLSYASDMLVVRADASNAKNAVATAGGSLLSAAVTSPGTSFTDVPTVTVSSGTGTATATLKVVSVNVNDGGTGYAIGNQFTVNLGNGTEAVFEVATLVPTSTIVATATIVSAGNYTDITSGLTGATTTNLTGTGSGLLVNIGLGLNTVTVSGGNYTVAPSLSANGGSTGGIGSVIATPILQASGLKINNLTDYLDQYVNGAGAVGEWAAKYPGALGNSITVTMADSATFAAWTDYKNEFPSAPNTSTYVAAQGGSNDELHILVLDALGLWTGTAGAVLERFSFVSKASDARLADGTNNFYKEVINNTSKYIWWMDHTSAGTNWGSLAFNTTFTSLSTPVTKTLVGGVTDVTPDAGDIQDAYLTMVNAEQYDISLVCLGAVTPATAKFVVENLAEVRKDCVAFVSPCTTGGDRITGVDSTAIVAATVAFRTGVSFNVNSSYAVLDSGWKYQYDRYNDVYRWVPLNGDIAGLCARTDYTNDAWWSPGGLNRGLIKNVIKLNVSPNKSQRDDLYKNGINPVVSFPGQGTVLFGDKTLLAKPSAFDRINVRRLFIVLEKAISAAARFQLFEFNDSFTRAQFRALVEPFLRDVQGRRGVTDFRVVCDDTNNTGQIIDSNQFVADIYIKPARSINFITLNFIAARTSVAFEEIGG